MHQSGITSGRESDQIQLDLVNPLLLMSKGEMEIMLPSMPKGEIVGNMAVFKLSLMEIGAFKMT